MSLQAPIKLLTRSMQGSSRLQDVRRLILRCTGSSAGSSSATQSKSPEDYNLDSPPTTTIAQSSSTTASHQHIQERVHTLFNNIVSEIKSSPGHSIQLNDTSGHEENKNAILRALSASVRAPSAERNELFQMIEDEFQMEISDGDFEQFRCLQDVVHHVESRLAIRALMLRASGGVNHECSYVNLNY